MLLLPLSRPLPSSGRRAAAVLPTTNKNRSSPGVTEPVHVHLVSLSYLLVDDERRTLFTKHSVL